MAAFVVLLYANVLRLCCSMGYIQGRRRTPVEEFNKRIIFIKLKKLVTLAKRVPRGDSSMGKSMDQNFSVTYTNAGVNNLRLTIRRLLKIIKLK